MVASDVSMICTQDLEQKKSVMCSSFYQIFDHIGIGLQIRLIFIFQIISN